MTRPWQQTAPDTQRQSQARSSARAIHVRQTTTQYIHKRHPHTCPVVVVGSCRHQEEQGQEAAQHTPNECQGHDRRDQEHEHTARHRKRPCDGCHPKRPAQLAQGRVRDSWVRWLAGNHSRCHCCVTCAYCAQRDEPDSNGEWHCWKDDGHHSKQWMQRIHLVNLGLQDQKDGSVRACCCFCVCVRVCVCSCVYLPAYL